MKCISSKGTTSVGSKFFHVCMSAFPVIFSARKITAAAMFSDTISNKLHLQKVQDFCIPSRGGKPYHVAAYVPGAKVISE